MIGKEDKSLYPFNNGFGNFDDFDSPTRRRRGPFQGGFPGSPPGSPGGAPGFGGTPQLSPPTSPPPSFAPQQFTTAQQQEFSRRGGVGGIRRCMFRNTYIWLNNGRSFWFFPMLVIGNQIIGFRWRERRGWVYDSLNRNRIAFFQCF